MGRKAYSYVVAGIKTTVDQCKLDGIDIYGQFEENEQGIKAIYGEGTDDVLIGKVLFEHNPYDYIDHAIELELPDKAWNKAWIASCLTALGVDASPDKVKLYGITVWL